MEENKSSWFETPCENRYEAAMALGSLTTALAILNALPEYAVLEDVKNDLAEMAEEIKTKLSLNEIGKEMLEAIKEEK